MLNNRTRMAAFVLALGCLLTYGWIGIGTGSADTDCAVEVSIAEGVERAGVVTVLNNSTTTVTVERENAARDSVDCPDSGTVTVLNGSGAAQTVPTDITLVDDKRSSRARFRVPANLTAGDYTLRVRVGNFTDTARFQVIDPEDASIGDAIVRDYGSEETAAGAPSIQNVILPQGGYVELRDENETVARSRYLPRGAYRLVVVEVNGFQGLRAVAVRGTADTVGMPYRRYGVPVDVSVSVGPFVVSPTPTPTPDEDSSGQTRGTTSGADTAATATTPNRTTDGADTAVTTTTLDRTTDGVGPGFGAVTATLAVLLYAAYRRRRRRR